MEKALAHVPGVAQGIAPRLRPDGQAVGFRADRDRLDVAGGDFDGIDELVEAPGQPEIFSVGADIAHVRAAAAGNRNIPLDLSRGKIEHRYAALALGLGVAHVSAAIGDIELLAVPAGIDAMRPA